MENPKKRSDIPTRKISTAQLGLEIGNNWDNKFPNLQVPNLNARTLQQTSQRLKDLLTAGELNLNQLKQNTVDLAALNKDINLKVRTLKNYIKIQCIGQPKTAVTAMYSSYGLIELSNIYALPRDNGFRQTALLSLVAKLQEPNNPIAMQTYGLRFWSDLQAHHSQYWNTSNQARANKSNYADQTEQLVIEVQKNLQHIRQCMKMQYSGLELNRQKRYIGFLKESL
jgi:hypothetical protein